MQYTTNLMPYSWSNLGEPLTASDLTAAFSDTNAFDARRFYSVLVTGPQ
jgi:hypothetical protein